MALLTARGISRVAIELLVRSLTVARTVTLIPGEEFSGSNGDTITVRVPQPSAARTQASRGAALTADDLNEIPISVVMEHKYHLKNLSDQEATFDVENFARQITRPQTEAVALGVEASLLTVMNALPATDAAINWDATATEADDKDTILRAREFLNLNDAPSDDRYLAVSSTIATRLLKYDFLTKVDASGTDAALRSGVIGRVFGFNVIEVPGMDSGEAMAYHRSGLVLATRAPVAARGAAESSSASAQGIALRQVFQYDPSTAQDQSLVSVFAGAAAVYEDGTGTNGTDEARFVKIVAGT